ncbi:hypothetical protein KY349_03630 [Candidatus Woesearchaeota archaeon]|jgi:hypothetical protein|nr:hypothetical protein [Candidatus Woesearchaeota archaeon]
MEELYNKLKEKHVLPDFDLLNKEFELYTIDEDYFLLREIRKKIIEKADSAVKLFDDILHPDPGFSSYREANVFSDSDRDGMIITYKRLMLFKRSATELSFEDSEESNARFINSFVKEWPDLKRSVLAFAKRLKDSWEKDIPKKEVVGYLG